MVESEAAAGIVTAGSMAAKHSRSCGCNLDRPGSRFKGAGLDVLVWIVASSVAVQLVAYENNHYSSSNNGFICIHGFYSVSGGWLMLPPNLI